RPRLPSRARPSSSTRPPRRASFTPTRLPTASRHWPSRWGSSRAAPLTAEGPALAGPFAFPVARRGRGLACEEARLALGVGCEIRHVPHQPLNGEGGSPVAALDRMVGRGDVFDRVGEPVRVPVPQLAPGPVHLPRCDAEVSGGI